MRYAYPAKLSQDGKDTLVTFRDVPEANTPAGDTEVVQHEARDALQEALGGYAELKRSIPAPSAPKADEILIEVTFDAS